MNYTGTLTLASPAPPPPILKIKPGDIIVISTPANLSEKAMDTCLEGAQRYFPGHKIAILTNGLAITTIRPSASDLPDPQDLGLITPGE